MVSSAWQLYVNFVKMCSVTSTSGDPTILSQVDAVPNRNFDWRQFPANSGSQSVVDNFTRNLCTRL